MREKSGRCTNTTNPKKLYSNSRRELPQNFEREKYNGNPHDRYSKSRDKQRNHYGTGYSKM